MAKAEWEFAPERLPSFRGSFYLRRWRGKLVMCKWPKKQKKQKSPKRKAAMEQFAEAAEAIKLMHWSQIERAQEITIGTQALWRDALFMSMYGRMPVILTIDNQEYRPMASRVDVTKILDSLGLVEGGVLYRGEYYWEILPPGEANQVLKYNALTNTPYWADESGGGAPDLWTQLSTEGFSSSNNASKGTLFQLPFDVTISAISAMFQSVNGQTYDLRLFLMDGASFGPLIFQSAPATLSGNIIRYLTAEIEEPIFIEANTQFSIMLTRTSSTDTAALAARANLDLNLGFPWEVEPQQVIIPNNDPQPMDTPSIGSNAFVTNFRYRT